MRRACSLLASFLRVVFLITTTPSSAVKDLINQNVRTPMVRREPNSKSMYESQVLVPSIDSSDDDASVRVKNMLIPKLHEAIAKEDWGLLSELSSQLEHVAGKSKHSITSASVQNLLFWEIDANNDAILNMTECQEFVHKPNCRQCLAVLYQEQGITNTTELELRLCADLGITSDNDINLTDFTQALQQTNSAASLMQASSLRVPEIMQRESEHDEIDGDELGELDGMRWDCG